MMSKPLQIIALLTCCQISVSVPATERKMTPEEYIKNFNEVAVKEMLMYDIPASITLAQGMLESNYGNSDLAVYANNHFGIKCHEKWDGQTYIKDDDQKDECFRKYPSVLDSYSDHSKFLKLQSRYAALFDLKRNDYKGWAKGLKQIGYATDPQYTQRLLHLIETYKLYEYDNVEGQKPKESINVKVNQVQNNRASTHERSTGSKTTKTHEILWAHFVKYVIVNPGDSFSKIAQDTDKDLWQLYKYNDLTANDKLVPGQIIYLQPKRRKAEEPFHIVKKGETMKSISQTYGIKLKSLYRKNNMKPGEEPTEGQQLNMRTRKK